MGKTKKTFFLTVSVILTDAPCRASHYSVFRYVHRQRLWARTATAPTPMCRACTCRRVLVSWTFSALASGRVCCLLRPCNGRALWGGGTQTALAAVVWSHWATPRASGFVCMFVVGTCTWLCAGHGDSCGTGVDARVLACLRACRACVLRKRP